MICYINIQVSDKKKKYGKCGGGFSFIFKSNKPHINSTDSVGIYTIPHYYTDKLDVFCIIW